MGKKEKKVGSKSKSSQQDVSKDLSKAFEESGVNKSIAEIANAFAAVDMTALKSASNAFAAVDMTAFKNVADNISGALQTSLKLVAPLAGIANEGKNAAERLKMLKTLQSDFDVFLNSPALFDLSPSNSLEIKRLRQENKKLKRELEKAKAAMEVKPLDDDRDYQ